MPLNEPANKLPLILLSGMGADHRVFTPQKLAFPHLKVADWIAPQPKERIDAYAQRMAEDLQLGTAPCYIGGASFGGMVAMEMMQHLNVQACFLIGSIQRPTELPIQIKALRPLTPICERLPFGLLQHISRGLRTLGGNVLSQSMQGVMRQLEDSDQQFMRWALGALLRWSTQPERTGPVLHIHGARDRILPARRTSPTQTIPGGGHVISLTHARAVNEFLRQGMLQDC